jgi:hypothetical protein
MVYVVLAYMGLETEGAQEGGREQRKSTKRIEKGSRKSWSIEILQHPKLEHKWGLNVWLSRGRVMCEKQQHEWIVD